MQAAMPLLSLCVLSLCLIPEAFNMSPLEQLFRLEIEFHAACGLRHAAVEMQTASTPVMPCSSAMSSSSAP